MSSRIVAAVAPNFKLLWLLVLADRECVRESREDPGREDSSRTGDDGACAPSAASPASVSATSGKGFNRSLGSVHGGMYATPSEINSLM